MQSMIQAERGEAAATHEAPRVVDAAAQLALLIAAPGREQGRHCSATRRKQRGGRVSSLLGSWEPPKPCRSQHASHVVDAAEEGPLLGAARRGHGRRHPWLHHHPCAVVPAAGRDERSPESQLSRSQRVGLSVLIGGRTDSVPALPALLLPAGRADTRLAARGPTHCLRRRRPGTSCHRRVRSWWAAAAAPAAAARGPARRAGGVRDEVGGNETSMCRLQPTLTLRSTSRLV